MSSKIMKIYIATDHAGFELKNKLKPFLAEKSYEVEDEGAYELNPEDDYPDFISKAAKKLAEDVKNGLDSRAILLGGSGQGEAMVANRFKGVRAAVYYGGSEEIVRLSRQHNNANALALGARFISEDEAKKALETWLKIPFAGGRHQKRTEKIDQI